MLRSSLKKSRPENLKKSEQKSSVNVKTNREGSVKPKRKLPKKIGSEKRQRSTESSKSSVSDKPKPRENSVRPKNGSA